MFIFTCRNGESPLTLQYVTLRLKWHYCAQVTKQRISQIHVKGNSGTGLCTLQQDQQIYLD